jgi:hypothetical protein
MAQRSKTHSFEKHRNTLDLEEELWRKHHPGYGIKGNTNISLIKYA